MARVTYKEPASYFNEEMLKAAEEWDREHAKGKAKDKAKDKAKPEKKPAEAKPVKKKPAKKKTTD